MHLAPAIVQQIYGPVKELDVIALEPELERLVAQALNSPHGASLDPGVADTLDAQRRRDRAPPGRPRRAGLPAGARRDPRADGPPAEGAAPRLKVLGHSEIPDTHSIRIGSIIGSAA